MTLKILTQLSHFITMLFGIALGMTLTILYQYVNQGVDLIIMNLYSPIIIITFIGVVGINTKSEIGPIRSALPRRMRNL